MADIDDDEAVEVVVVISIDIMIATNPVKVPYTDDSEIPLLFATIWH